jgi:hypothetical protein
MADENQQKPTAECEENQRERNPPQSEPTSLFVTHFFNHAACSAFAAALEFMRTFLAITAVTTYVANSSEMTENVRNNAGSGLATTKRQAFWRENPRMLAVSRAKYPRTKHKLSQKGVTDPWMHEQYEQQTRSFCVIGQGNRDENETHVGYG